MPGIDGMVHISQIADHRVEKSRRAKEGQSKVKPCRRRPRPPQPLYKRRQANIVNLLML